MLNDLKNTYFDDMKKVDDAIRSLLTTDNVKMQEMINWQLKSSGKRLRPLLMVISSKFGNCEEHIYQFAAVIEIIHMASLIHDDVIDNSDIRRGRLSIQKKFGQKMAVYMGDYMIFKAFRNLNNSCFDAYKDILNNAKYRKSIEVSLNNSNKYMDLIENIMTGELGQYNSLYYTDVNEEIYIKNISGKTAALFELACNIGTMETRCSDSVCEALDNYGRCIGVAFQIRDDILDFTVGGHKDKPVFCDFANGIYTLPVIYALENPKYKKTVKDMAEEIGKGNDDKIISELLNILEETKGLERAKGVLNSYCEEAIKSIALLPDNIHKESLYTLAKSVRL